MNRLLLRLAAPLLVALCSASFAGHALAQATRTWVSGVGDDVNPCSRTAPCKTFAGAISKTAAGGEISVLDPGGFGAVTITKSITINGAGTLASILGAGTNGIVINDVAHTGIVVVIRDLHIHGAGTGINGIQFVSGAELHVENCEIQGFTGQGINFAPSGASELYVSRTNILSNIAGGVYVVPTSTGSATATFDAVHFDGNGRGLRVEDATMATVTNSVAHGNTNNGFVAVSTTRAVTLNLDRTVSSSNGAAGVYSGGAQSTVRIGGTTVVNNGMLGLQSATGGAIASFRNNQVSGNAGGDGAPTVLINPI